MYVSCIQDKWGYFRQKLNKMWITRHGKDLHMQKSQFLRITYHKGSKYHSLRATGLKKALQRLYYLCLQTPVVFRDSNQYILCICCIFRCIIQHISFVVKLNGHCCDVRVRARGHWENNPGKRPPGERHAVLTSPRGPRCTASSPNKFLFPQRKSQCLDACGSASRLHWFDKTIKRRQRDDESVERHRFVSPFSPHSSWFTRRIFLLSLLLGS